MEVGNDGLINAASRSQVGVHRSTTNVIRPVPLAGSHPTASIVTLDSRRPRAQNEYVDSPPTEGQTLQSKKVSRPVRTKVEGNIQRTTVLPRQDRVSQEREADTHHVVFTSQPKPLVKPPTIGSVEADLSHEDDSIICKHCGKCRCDRCKEMQKLPSYWLCNKKCHLSADSALKVCTCLCAVECCFYHYAKDYQMDADVMCTDYPCACCSRPHCCKRWLCMAAMSVCLPCLCCYWPAKCGIKLCTACYNRCTNKGCQCTRSERGSQNKRLLESDSSSA